MLILDTILFGGIKFVRSKIAEAVNSELNDKSRLREELLAAQMRLELGEITDEEFAEVETALLRRLREIREEQMADAPSPKDFKVTGIEATVRGDETEDEDESDGGTGTSRGRAR